jgi:hypothetical protein
LFSVDDNTSEGNSLASQLKRAMQVFNGIPIQYTKPDLTDSKNKFIETKEYLISHNSTFRVGKAFENSGWDVDLNFYHTVPNYWLMYKDLRDLNISIEIKPSLGDDYPVILRQMKAVANRIPSTKCLVYDKFNASGATLEQIKGIFATAYFRIYSISEIKNAQKELLLNNQLSTDI